MQLTMHKVKGVDFNRVKSVLVAENKFVEELFALLPIPASAHQHLKEDEDEDEAEEPEARKLRSELAQAGDKTRANSLQELQSRLAAIKSKGRLTYREKLVKKGLKNRIKKKTKRDERNALRKQSRAALKTEEEETADAAAPPESKQPKKPVFNADNKMVFSKFDFSDIGDETKKKNRKKQTSDPKKLLKDLQKQNEKLGQLEESGEAEKAVEMKEKSMWKNALAKAEGRKVKDDVTLLKKSVKKKEQMKRASKKKWENRLEGVKKAKEERQKKRTQNIDKRKKEKKVKKIKQAVKRGKVIPGY